MELILTRTAKRKDYTIGRLSAPHQLPPEGGEQEVGNASQQGNVTSKTSPSGGWGALCDTLEPPVVEMKTRVSKDAVLRSMQKARALKPFAIPEGRYAVVITYSPKFGKWLPLLIGDQNFNRMFQGIRIHACNTAGDTQGCILPGENLKKGMVLNSNRWVKRLKNLITEAKERGEPVWLTVR